VEKAVAAAPPEAGKINRQLAINNRQFALHRNKELKILITQPVTYKVTGFFIYDRFSCNYKFALNILLPKVFTPLYGDGGYWFSIFK
jgi:hypothetical protein